jgi:hypothetical protein
MTKQKIMERIERLNNTKLVVPSKYEILGEKVNKESTDNAKVEMLKLKMVLKSLARILSARKIPAEK